VGPQLPFVWQLTSGVRAQVPTLQSVAFTQLALVLEQIFPPQVLPEPQSPLLLQVWAELFEQTLLQVPVLVTLQEFPKHEPSPIVKLPTVEPSPVGALSTTAQLPVTSLFPLRQEVSASNGKPTSKWLRPWNLSTAQSRLQVSPVGHWLLSRQL